MQRSLLFTLIAIALIWFSGSVHAQQNLFVNHQIYEAATCDGSPTLINSYLSGACQPWSEGVFKKFTCGVDGSVPITYIDTCSDSLCSTCDDTQSTSITNNACGTTHFQFALPQGYVGMSVCGPLIEAANPATFVAPFVNATCSDNQYNSYPIGVCSFSKNFSCIDNNSGLKLDLYNQSDCSGGIISTTIIQFDTCLEYGIANSTQVIYSCTHYGQITSTTTTTITTVTSSSSSSTSTQSSSSSKVSIAGLGLLLAAIVVSITW